MKTNEYMYKTRSLLSVLLIGLVLFGCSKDEVDSVVVKENEVTFNAKYKIPVVIHLTNTTNDFLSEDEVKEIIYNMNVYYNAKNSDLKDVFDPFKSIIGNPEIEFVLAKKTQNNEITSGITKTVTDKSELSEVTAIEKENCISLIKDIEETHSKWDGDKYLNIFLCKSMKGNGFVMGNDAKLDFGVYSSLPPHNSFQIGGKELDKKSMLTGVFVDTSIGVEGISRTLVHEVGHWLGLKHVTGYNGTFAISEEEAKAYIAQVRASGDGEFDKIYKLHDDDIEDTPWSFINTDDLTVKVLDAYVNIENIMMNRIPDSKIKGKMFTKGQVEAMYNALNNEKGGRNNLWSEDNLKTTGIID